MSTRSQCEIKGCSAVAAKNLPCCREHVCDEDGCIATVALSEDKKLRFDLCPSHKCAYSGCGLKRAAGFDGCAGQHDHTCQVLKCQNVTIDQDSIVCPGHINFECSEEGCHFMTTKKGSERQLYCNAHVKCKNCSNFRLAHSTGCSTHTCMRRGCYKTIRKGAYCIDHKCSAETCLQSPMVNDAGVFRKTCFIHTCQFPNCTEVNKTERIGYCKTHHDEKQEKARADQAAKVEAEKAEKQAELDKKIAAEEQVKAQAKAKAEKEAKEEAEALAEKKAKEDKAKAEEEAKAQESAKAEAEKSKLQLARISMTNGTTESSTTMDDLVKLLEALQKSQLTSFAEVKASLKQIDEFDRQTILALAKAKK
ncbi:hypothetical protein BP6252_09694 [Coleophoma cylindrospora]|uniref:Uncharacterized protein n=1 Tax=Coleophoma cylindrospora TaxID=1849047 RepID=A0A3D8QWC3_9HELO|nr:hypothetical protein BP6252_09694 [Coleophoma cylindrospora]